MPRTTAKRVTLNAASNVAVVFLEIAVGMLLVPLMLKHLGLAANGVWETTGALFGYALLLQFGINSAINYHVPRLVVEKNTEGLSRLVSSAAAFYALMGGVVLLATLVIAANFPRWFNIEPRYHSDSRVLALLVGGYFSVSLPLSVFQGVLSGLQAYTVMSSVRLVTRVLRALLIAVALWSGGGLIAVGIIHITTRLTELMAMPILAKRALPELRVSRRLADFATVRSMLGYSVNSMIWSSSELIMHHAGKLVLCAMVTTTHTSLYSNTMMIVMAIATFGGAIAAVAKPAATALVAEGRTDSVAELSLRGSRYVVMALLPFIIVLGVFGDAALGLWTGKEEYRAMHGILAVLLVAELFVVGQRVAAMVLVGLGRHRAFAMVTIASALISVVVSIVGIAVWDLGLWGVAIGQAIANVLIGLAFLPFYVPHVLRRCWSDHVRRIFGGPFCCMAPLFVAALLLRRVYVPTSLPAMGLLMAAACVLAAGCYWMAGMNRQERGHISRMLVRPFRRAVAEV